MSGQAPPPAPFRVAFRAQMDRRRVEALALELRRRVKQLGFDGATITITPAPEDASAPPAREEPSA